MIARRSKKSAPALKSDPNRNLTHERDLATLEAAKKEAVSKTPQYATQLAWVEKKDAKGNLVLDDDKVPVLVEKRVLKRTIIAAQHDDKISAYRQMRGLGA